MRHVRRHRFDSPFRLACPVCGKRYRNFQSWQRHLQQSHFHVETDLDSHTAEHVSLPLNRECVEVYSQSTSQQRHSTSVNTAARHKVAKLVNLLKDNHLPESACSAVLSACHDISISAIEESREQVQAGNPSVEHLPSISSLTDFQSNYKFNQYIERELPYVAPETIRLGQGDKDTYQYISLLNQIKHLVQLESLKGYIFKTDTEQSSNEQAGQRLYTDVFDGCSHPQRERDTVYLSISYDDFEVVNPLGSAASLHKLAALHFSVLNAPIEVRSKRNTLFPLILSRASLLKKSGWDVILRPLIRDLQLLVEGIEVFIDNTPRKLVGSLLFICGDNLAVHSIAGFVESFSRKLSPCRHCLATPEEWQSKFSESEFTLRDEETYQSQLKEVCDSGQDRKVISQTGIKAVCAFSKLTGFRVTEQFPPDIAHDILGGVVPYILSLVLTTLVKKRLVSVDDLNERITTFPWNSVGDRPKHLRIVAGTGKIRIRQSASQTWTLLRYLPILLGDLVPDDCVEWQLITELCDIVENIFSWRFCEGDLIFLEQKISDWLRAVKSAYPVFWIKPKFHYMVHYITQIRRHGPLRNCWTMRYESKYGFLKGLIRESKNFRNVAKSIALKHQNHIAFQLHSGSLFRTELVNLKFVANFEGIPEDIATEVKSNGARLAMQFTWNGTVFRAGDAVQLNDADEQPADGELAEIVAAACKPNDDVRLVLRLLRTHFVKHINAYEIEQGEKCIMLPLSKMASCKPVPLHTVYGSRFAVLKYRA